MNWTLVLKTFIINQVYLNDNEFSWSIDIFLTSRKTKIMKQIPEQRTVKCVFQLQFLILYWAIRSRNFYLFFSEGRGENFYQVGTFSSNPRPLELFSIHFWKWKLSHWFSLKWFDGIMGMHYPQFWVDGYYKRLGLKLRTRVSSSFPDSDKVSHMEAKNLCRLQEVWGNIIHAWFRITRILP